MKNNTMPVVLVLLTLLSLCAVGSVVGLAMLGVFFLRPSALPMTRAQIMVPVVVAAVDLPAGTVLDEPERQLVIRPFAAGTVPANALADADNIRGHMLKAALRQGAPLLANDVTNDALVLEPGQRAISITVGLEQALVGFLIPGSRVDILNTTPDPDDPTRQLTRTIVQDVQVLAVFVKPAQADKVVVNAFQVTVALTPEDARTVTQAKGSLSIVLRRPKGAD